MKINKLEMRAYSILFVFLLSSCSTKVENVLEGLWSIDTIYYRNYDIRSCLYINTFFFSGDKTVFLPGVRTDSICNTLIIASEDKFADWSISTSPNVNDTLPLRISLTTTNKLFEGIHKIVFHSNTEERILEMEMYSDSLYVVCRRPMDPQRNRELLKELEDLSWTNRHENVNK